MLSSTPSFDKYDPYQVNYQAEFLSDLFYKFDYSLGVHECLLWGTVGSGKSLPGAWAVVFASLHYEKNRILIARKALPDLKSTIFNKILELLEGSPLKDGIDYHVNMSTAFIRFKNGSEILSRSWSDRKYKKLGSIEVSSALIEEITENDEQDQQAYDYIKMRCGRLKHIPRSFILGICNPDDPSHWVRKRFFDRNSNLIHTYESHLRDNKFLHDHYENSVRDGLDPMMAKRMLENEWISIGQELLYYSYKREDNFRNYSYKVNEKFPIIVSWDFNIGLNKPLSACFMQYVNGEFHVFDEVVVEGIRTLDSLDEMYERGLLDYNTRYLIYGDATGRHRDTRSKTSDWDIIETFFARSLNRKTKRPIRYSVEVGVSNPPIRTRHNKVNGMICNANDLRRLFVYKDAPTVDEGLRMTKLKSGAQYLEDDSSHFQHITTALGYAVCGVLSEVEETTGVYSYAR